MPRKKVQVVRADEAEQRNANVDEPTDTGHDITNTDTGHDTTCLTKADYLKAKATIKQFREEKKAKPKRKCSEAQLAALAAGREKNKRFAKNQVKPSD